MLEIVGILLIVQGIGGFLNNWTGGSPSWFVVNHVPLLDGWELSVSAVVALVGLVLAERGARRRRERAS